MPLKIIRNDITKMDCDVIVNPTNEMLMPTGGVDYRVHERAGKELMAELKKIGRLSVGETVVTRGYKLPCKCIIHVVSPHFNKKEENEELLRQTYKVALNCAREYNLTRLALPLIGSGENHFPKALALRIAVDEISKFLFENEMSIFLVVYDKESFNVTEGIFSGIDDYISTNYEEPYDPYSDINDEFMCGDIEERHEHIDTICARMVKPKGTGLDRICDIITPIHHDEDNDEIFSIDSIFDFDSSYKRDISDQFRLLDECFQEALFRHIDEKGMDDVVCYKRANIDRKIFSKIKCNKNYKPSKNTAICFAIALELNKQETQHLLSTAGFTLSRSNKFDVIIEYCIEKKIYDIHRINEALFAFDQALLG
ncbi:MAG: macro domain-containing protein [Clostridia bacterium]|nr:macro domain-containing protein [Clostridia bacterium]